MEVNNRDSVWAECEKLGEAAVRARIDSGAFGAQSLLPREWLIRAWPKSNKCYTNQRVRGIIRGRRISIQGIEVIVRLL